MAKDFVRSKDNVKNITTEKIDHTEVNDLLHDGKNSYIHTPKHEFHNLLDNIKQIEFSGSDLISGEKSGNNYTLNLSELNETILYLNSRINHLENNYIHLNSRINHLENNYIHLPVSQLEPVVKDIYMNKPSGDVIIDMDTIIQENYNFIGTMFISLGQDPSFAFPFSIINGKINHNFVNSNYVRLSAISDTKLKMVITQTKLNQQTIVKMQGYNIIDRLVNNNIMAFE